MTPLGRIGRYKLGAPISDHVIHHQRAPIRWEEGLPLGNGELGVMVWGNGNPFAFTLDKADLWDLRRNGDYTTHPDFNYAGLRRLVVERRFSEVDEIFEQRELRDNPIGPTKISIGRAELHLGEPTRYECQLKLGTAVIEGTIHTYGEGQRFQCFVHREINVFCLHVSSLPSEARMRLIPLAEMNDVLAKLGHPKPQFEGDRDLHVLLQSIPDGPFYAVAWNGSGPDFYLAVETAASAKEALTRARATWRQAATEGFDNLLDQHTQAWETFWEGSTIYLPERRMEFLWYYGLYLLASSSRRGSLPPGLQGLWPMDGVMPPWRGDYHADMNVQESFWPAFASGHLDLVDSWCDLMRECIDPAKEFTRRFFGTEGTFWVCCTLPKYTIVPCWHTVQFGWSHSSWLGWLVWLRWRYSMDMKWLAETGYPVIAEIFRFYRANLVEEQDGYLHIPLSSSPEYKENKPNAWCKDPNIDIALISRCCDWVVEMEHALGVESLSRDAKKVRERLVPYHLTEDKELCLWAGKPLDESHRHPSHLMAIHPAMDLTVEDNEYIGIIDASLRQYLSLGQYLWAGHTYAQMVSFAAVIGRGEFAYYCLLHFWEYWLGPNGLHFNRDIRYTGTTLYHGKDLQFTLEASCGVSAGISDMLVQGWGDKVRIFPALPGHWRDAAFRNLLTEGAFRVSALRRDGRTVWVNIVATVARTLRLYNPFGNTPIEVEGAILNQEGDSFVVDLKRGQEVTLWLKGVSVNFIEEATLSRHSDITRLGLR